MEVLPLKTHYHWKTSIFALDASQFEYDDLNMIYTKSECVNSIKKTLKRYNILPNASEYKEDGNKLIYIPVSIITDGAYKAAKDIYGGPLCASKIREKLDLSPLYIGWDDDPPHQIEGHETESTEYYMIIPNG